MLRCLCGLDDPGHRGVARLIRDLNTTYSATSALWSRDTTENGFHWIDANDAAGNVYSFLRFGDDGSVLACVANFSAIAGDARISFITSTIRVYAGLPLAAGI